MPCLPIFRTDEQYSPDAAAPRDCLLSPGETLQETKVQDEEIIGFDALYASMNLCAKMHPNTRGIGQQRELLGRVQQSNNTQLTIEVI